MSWKTAGDSAKEEQGCWLMGSDDRAMKSVQSH